MTAAAPGLVVVSNRLPVEADDAGQWRLSPGGLVAAMIPVMERLGGAWVGWPGKAGLELEPFDHGRLRLEPVPLDEAEVAEYYEGFANDTIWPLYHDVIVSPQYHREWWLRTVAVNRRFAERAAAIAAPGGLVWVHDYQLQLVPAMLRELRPDVRIGYFHHIPFPGYGLYSQLPWRREILRGLLGADVIGFQRPADAANFSQAAGRLLGAAARSGRIEVDEPGPDGVPRARRVLVKVYPISIDFARFAELAARPEVAERAREIRRGLGSPERVLFGVDRLDYTKGIAHRLKAFGELLAEQRLLPGQVVLVQVASPSRENVDQYRQLRDEVELMVSRINGDQADLGYQPIQYLHQNFSPEEMVALYLASDMLLVTALRDGMNLVAKEYAASRIDDDGVLVLSEFAGASDELRRALIVNPHDIEGLKAAIMNGLEMPLAERRSRMRALRRRVREHDVTRWSEEFLADLGGATESQP